MNEPWEVNVRKVANGRNVYEVDVSKEDIATGGASQAEAEFFGLHTNTGSNKSASSTREEESMPAARSRTTKREVEESVMRGEEIAITLVIHTPRHLWGLGATQFHFQAATTDDAFDIIGKMQENFEWMEKEFADRLADVAALENRISEAQKELLATLAEEMGEDLPDLTDYSKTEASKLIRELMSQRGSKPQPRRSTSRRSRTTRRPSSRPTSGRRQTKTSGRTGRRTGGGRKQFDNTKPGGATDKMKDFLVDLCRQAGTDAPTDDELDNQMTYDDVSAEITELREALGYGDN